MIPMALEHLSELGRAIPHMPDTRPEMLRSLPNANAPDALYYRFLYEIGLRFRPAVSLETGTWFGISAAHLAVAHPEGRIITLDISNEVIIHVDALDLKNITLILSDTRNPETLEKVKAKTDTIELLFLDSEHSYSVVSEEFRIYSPLVSQGGIIVLDDIHLNSEMERFWNELPDPKCDLSHLHTCMGAGYGLLLKS